MSKIIGDTTATPSPRPDWKQKDENKADYIKNKPEHILLYSEQILTEEQQAQARKNIGATGLMGDIILMSPGGKKFKLVVDESGRLSTVEVQ